MRFAQRAGWPSAVPVSGFSGWLAATGGPAMVDAAEHSVVVVAAAAAVLKCVQTAHRGLLWWWT